MDFLNDFPTAFYSAQAANTMLSKWREDGDQVVFTNGCFDLLHVGHICYLQEAKLLGDRLVVGVNSDASVRRLKGSHRPIKDEKNRMAILSALSMVDACILFEEATPYQLIKSIAPNVLVKGGDWNVEEIVGSDLVLSNGGTVQSLSFLEGYSTSLLEEKIRNEGNLGE